MDEELISETLEAMADRRTAAATSKSVRPLKGVRGVPNGEIARIAAAVWLDTPPDPDEDLSALNRLFGAAYEDGLLAIGLLAAMLPDAPDAALQLARDWLERVDDIFTADALGWLVLGPGLAATRTATRHVLAGIHSGTHPAARRAVLMAGMAWTPARLEGPSAAPLRARLKVKQVRFVEHALTDRLAELADAFVRDTDPAVRKALRRVLRAWSKSDPAGAVAWAESVRGGLPKLYKSEIDRARRQLKAQASRTDASDL